MATIENNVTNVALELEGSQIGFIKSEESYQIWLGFRNIYEDSKEMFHHLTEESGIGMGGKGLYL
ncbi:MAG: hypothetical protein L3J79_03195 [Candidatus Marinimicrobia bacterium]|nr:hypothetical protein [Candidatus Neomarinimicrobiota bacterium]